jgi:hypothetical protein
MTLPQSSRSWEVKFNFKREAFEPDTPVFMAEDQIKRQKRQEKILTNPDVRWR